MTGYWRLTVYLRGGNNHYIVGTEETMRDSFEQIENAMKTDMGVKAVLVHGCSDTYDRAESTMLVSIEDVALATLVRW